MMSLICDVICYVIKNGLLAIVTLALFVTSPTAQGRKEHRYITPAPIFNPTESNYTYHKGERAILYCSVKNLGTKTVIWRRVNESIPLTIGKLPLIDDKRYEVAHIDESQDWNLMISNVTTHETGAYECQVSAVDRELRKKVYLTVRDEYSYAEPQITISGKLHVDRGMELRLMCNATGALTPPDTIDWFKDGSKITADNFRRIELRKRLSINSRTITSILSKAHADMGDAATYTCRTSDLQVESVKVNVLNTDKKSRKRDITEFGCQPSLISFTYDPKSTEVNKVTWETANVLNHVTSNGERKPTNRLGKAKIPTYDLQRIFQKHPNSSLLFGCTVV